MTIIFSKINYKLKKSNFLFFYENFNFKKKSLFFRIYNIQKNSENYLNILKFIFRIFILFLNLFSYFLILKTIFRILKIFFKI